MTKSMATDTKRLTRLWIQYLKNNKIVALKSDPATGRLSYNRPVTSDDVSKFLETESEFSEEEISNAVHMVLAKNTINKAGQKLPNNSKPGGDLSTWHHYGMSPGDRPEAEQDPKEIGHTQAAEPESPQKARVKYDPDSVSDIDYREKDDDETPRRPRLNEEITDNTGYELGEDDVEQIFGMLASGKGKEKQQSASRVSTGSKSATPKGTEPELSPEQELAEKQEKVRKIKRLIREVMTEAQRSALWRLLRSSINLSESQINDPDVEEIFKVAVDAKANPTGLKKFFRANKDTVSVNDLQRSWKEEGFPDDTVDIKAILLDHGFTEKEINATFATVFGKDDDGEYVEPTQSPAIQKIADYAKKHGIDKDIALFLQKEFGFKESAAYKDKLVIEDVRQLFTEIVNMERPGRNNIIREYEKAYLGRMKK